MLALQRSKSVFERGNNKYKIGGVDISYLAIDLWVLI
jgi:hypothetical protein